MEFAEKHLNIFLLVAIQQNTALINADMRPIKGKEKLNLNAITVIKSLLELYLPKENIAQENASINLIIQYGKARSQP